jgi:hypothetical protein
MGRGHLARVSVCEIRWQAMLVSALLAPCDFCGIPIPCPSKPSMRWIHVCPARISPRSGGRLKPMAELRVTNYPRKPQPGAKARSPDEQTQVLSDP